MRRSLLTFGILIATTGLAAADDGERIQVVSVEGGIGLPDPELGPADDYNDEYRPVIAARVSMAWEQRPLDLPAERGYAWRGGITPEISLGGVDWVDDNDDEHRHAFLQGGLRLDLAFAQREMGLLRISARGGMWLAGRAGVMNDDEHTPIGDVGLGWYLWLGDSNVRVGWQVGAMGMSREAGRSPTPIGPAPAADDDDATPIDALFYLGAFIGAAI